mmetsp:Transcript_14936/g.59934  ORF Transcript_14936/g.59934 Transcript_14936/m.59934 type:complete len:262 (+) Transcript_14936:2162-2947(+)
MRPEFTSGGRIDVESATPASAEGRSPDVPKATATPESAPTKSETTTFDLGGPRERIWLVLTDSGDQPSPRVPCTGAAMPSGECGSATPKATATTAPTENAHAASTKTFRTALTTSPVSPTQTPHVTARIIVMSGEMKKAASTKAVPSVRSPIAAMNEASTTHVTWSEFKCEDDEIDSWISSVLRRSVKDRGHHPADRRTTFGSASVETRTSSTSTVPKTDPMPSALSALSVAPRCIARTLKVSFTTATIASAVAAGSLEEA